MTAVSCGLMTDHRFVAHCLLMKTLAMQGLLIPMPNDNYIFTISVRVTPGIKLHGGHGPSCISSWEKATIPQTGKGMQGQKLLEGKHVLPACALLLISCSRSCADPQASLPCNPHGMESQPSPPCAFLPEGGTCIVPSYTLHKLELPSCCHGISFNPTSGRQC